MVSAEGERAFGVFFLFPPLCTCQLVVLAYRVVVDQSHQLFVVVPAGPGAWQLPGSWTLISEAQTVLHAAVQSCCSLRSRLASSTFCQPFCVAVFDLACVPCCPVLLLFLAHALSLFSLLLRHTLCVCCEPWC